LKRKILECAKEIVETEGLKALTISYLVKWCKISNRTFYESFKSKDDLLNELKKAREDVNINILDKKEMIIKKSRDIFARHGYSRIDMDYIAKAVGIKRSMLYRYFRTKDELLEYCFEYEMKNIKRELERIISAGQNPYDVLDNYISQFCRVISGPHENVLFYEIFNKAQHHEGLRCHAQKMHNFFISSFAKVFQDGIERGIFDSSIDIEAICIVILAALNGLSFFAQIDPSIDISNRVKNSLISMMNNTILKRSSIE